MKKNLLYLAVLAMLMSGCRQKGDIYLDPSDPINMSYTTYADQFEVIWRGMNTYYVFWSEDSTDWNERMFQYLSANVLKSKSKDMRRI